MRSRLFELFGPGGSFRITLGRPTADDAVFVSTVADTVAWEVAAALSAPRATPANHAADLAAPSTSTEHDELWRHIEEALLIRRTGPDSVEVDVQREVTAASRFRSARAAA